MSDQSGDDETIYVVIVNHEEQHAIWPADKDLPLGWHGDGFQGTKAQCLAHVKQVWTDMRPKSLREKMDRPFPDRPSAE